jgi:hypothetical protein
MTANNTGQPHAPPEGLSPLGMPQRDTFPDARWAAEVTAELRSLRDHFQHLEQTLMRTLQALDDQHTAHLLYHQQNEHTWGLLRLIQQHPTRALLLMIILLTLVLGKTTLDPALIRELITSISSLP